MNDKLTDQIIKSVYRVHNTLGAGFLEQVYQNAMVIELRKRGLSFSTQNPVDIFYDGILIGSYRTDIIVDEKLILELKANEYLHRRDEVQLVNYLQATGISYGLLINFGDVVTIKRKYKDYTPKRSYHVK